MSVNDFNNDFLPDLAFLYDWDYLDPDTAGRINIFYNLGHFQLTEPQKVPLTYFPDFWRYFSSADLDGNGYQDFVVARQSWDTVPGYLEVLFNDGNGNFVVTPSGIESPASTNNHAGLRCFPNPFSEFITFEFEIPQTAPVFLSVYDLQGRFIRCIIDEKRQKGKYSVTWNGYDKVGDPCKPGTFIAYLKIDGLIRQTVKFIKL
jgi:hypothetical protein